jgi:hypothetical protein
MKVSQQDALATAMKLSGGLDKLQQKVVDGAGANNANIGALADQVAAKLGGGLETRQVALDALMGFAFQALERGKTAMDKGVVAKGDANVSKGQINVGAGALLSVKGGSALDGIDLGKIKEFNLKGLSLPKEIIKIADQVFGDREARIATAGYSAPPAGTKYAENGAQFLAAFTSKLGKENVGHVTSPTADQGSVDAMTTMVGQQVGVPTLSITAKDYVGYIDPSKFPPDMDKAAYANSPKHVFGDKAKYNQATALASTAFLAMGGRDVTVFDFMRAIEKGNPVVLMVDDSMRAPMGDKAVYDADKKRPNNGSAYLAEQISSFLKTGELAHPEVQAEGMGHFGKEWMDDCKLLLEKLVKVVHTDGTPESTNAAAAKAAEHVRGFVMPSANQAMNGFRADSVDDLKGRVKDNYLDSAYQYTGVTSQQLSFQTKDIPGAATHMGEAKRQLDDLVHKTVRHFGAGKYGMLDEAPMNSKAIKQHAGYIAGEMSRKFGFDEKAARAVLVPFYEATKDGASPEARAKLADDLLKVPQSGGREISPDPASVKEFVTSGNNGWMFNEYGFGDADKALNRPGVYAGEAVLEFAKSIAGDKGAAALLKRSLERSPEELAKALSNPKSTEDLVVAFSARAAQAGWLVSKTGQGIVEAHHSNPEKAAKGLNRVGPKNDLITDFDSLAEKKGWAEVAKDLDQVKTALWGAGVLS